jgi:hypothetical protein
VHSTTAATTADKIAAPEATRRRLRGCFRIMVVPIVRQLARAGK